MQIKARILDNGLLWCNEHTCKYSGVCANHCTAVNANNVDEILQNKISPSIYIDFEGKIFCYTQQQKKRKSEFAEKPHPEYPYDSEFGPLFFEQNEINVVKGPHSIWW